VSDIIDADAGRGAEDGWGLSRLLFTFFLALVLFAFVWSSVMKFFPWSTTLGIILLVAATLLLAVSLVLPRRLGVIANGVLLGGALTAMSAGTTVPIAVDSVLDVLVVASALATTILVGYLRLGRKTAPAVPDRDEDPSLLQRLETLEGRVEELGRADGGDT
jgi:hypothetical protein